VALPADLVALQESPDFSGSVRLASASASGDTIRLEVEVDATGETPRTWRIDCVGVHDARVSPAQGLGALWMTTEHVVLHPHTGDCPELLFRGTPTNPKAVLADLWLAHREVTEGWFPFDHFLNDRVPLPDLLRGPFGLLAVGPVMILKAYAKVLVAHGLSTQIADPHSWSPVPWRAEYPSLTALFIEPDRFVVAKSFDFTEV
jgi:hypothetical protein